MTWSHPFFEKCALAWGLFWGKFRATGKATEEATGEAPEEQKGAKTHSHQAGGKLEHIPLQGHFGQQEKHTKEAELGREEFVTPKGVLPLAMCHASATREGP